MACIDAAQYFAPPVGVDVLDIELRKDGKVYATECRVIVEDSFDVSLAAPSRVAAGWLGAKLVFAERARRLTAEVQIESSALTIAGVHFDYADLISRDSLQVGRYETSVTMRGPVEVVDECLRRIEIANVPPSLSSDGEDRSGGVRLFFQFHLEDPAGLVVPIEEAVTLLMPAAPKTLTVSTDSGPPDRAGGVNSSYHRRKDRVLV
jgi:hypothetical protein